MATADIAHFAMIWQANGAYIYGAETQAYMDCLHVLCEWFESGEFIEEETYSLCYAEHHIAYPMGLIVYRKSNWITKYCEDNDLDASGGRVISSN